MMPLESMEAYFRESNKKMLVKAEKKLLITIDGPAGSGKSTVSKALSQKLSYLYLDTGALYRAIAYKIIKEERNPDDLKSMRYLMDSLNLRLEAGQGFLTVILDNTDITERLRTEEVGLLASRISTLPLIRDSLLPIQRKFGSSGGVVAEGRDMGTVVFPNADLKFFLSATSSVRALRRHKELVKSGASSDLDEIKRMMALRDRQDTERSTAPLKIPNDAVVVDSTTLSFEDVVSVMLTSIYDMLT